MFRSIVTNMLLSILLGSMTGCTKDEIIIKDGDYYVAPDGNDDNPGTKEQPWATWGKAFTSTSVKAGDTVYFRGGVYRMTVTSGDGYTVTRGGNAGNWVCYSAYPGEVPILDCGNVASTVAYTTGVGTWKSDADYIIFRGLTIRNVWQNPNQLDRAAGFRSEDGHVKYENCTVYNVHGTGFFSNWYQVGANDDDEHYYINCDAYNCCDSLATPPALPGNGGSGFNSQNFFSANGHASFNFCRAWNCGDQGFSTSGDNYTEANGCWSFKNGMLEGDGHGFKLGWVEFESGKLRRVIRNCIAAYNRQSGMCTNDFGYDVVCRMNIYNNTIYHNGYYVNWPNNPYGIYVDNTAGTDAAELTRVFKNNISYKNEYGSVFVGDGAVYTNEYNSWNSLPGVNITDADFVSIDSTGLSGPRQADGSLPDLNFLKLTKGSFLIDAGINIGLPFRGKAPDLGAFERE